MRSVLSISLSCAIALALTSCGGKKQDAPAATTEAKPAAAKRISIAVIPKGTTHEFWKSIHAGAVKAARELDVDIIWKGPLKEDDREDQIKVVENFISRGVSGIVLAPLDDVALKTPVQAAAERAIPTIIIDSGLQGDAQVSFIATDNFNGGKMAGERLAEVLGGKGKVVMLRYQEGSASTMKREAGFMEAIGKHKGIQVVSDNQYGGATRDSALTASENLLSPMKTPTGALIIDGIYCPNESTTFGMLRALQNGGHAGRVKFVGFDSSAELVEAMKNNEIHGLILQDPMKMGYLGVKSMVSHLKGEQIEPVIDTGAVLVTPENMAEPEVKNLLSPDLSKWLDS
ncbi:MAG: substrate-binding domain-containing protein [Verrucomicrobia bacterium]|nr:substrate-binding domain-containing protein [Verrucomicrobiota bacterium]MDA1085400.1 substrate-binding domain-containing protein [Verrucomicrobiota bacterium]